MDNSPLVSKRSETRGELSIMVFFCPKFRLFFYLFWTFGDKKKLPAAPFVYFFLYVDCGTSSIVLETTTSKCGLSATDENGSEYFRQMMDDFIGAAGENFCNVGHRNRDF